MSKPTEVRLDNVFRIVAAVITSEDGEYLLVRKRGTQAFMNCGGKIEPGESPEEALRREIHEEVGMDVGQRVLTPLGRHTAPAANEPGWSIDCDLFAVLLEDKSLATARAEIEELRWVRPDDALAALRLAPLAARVLRGELT
ncbi:MAG TPA: NUDIX domain-containing protein [Jatrophihabitans sp.]